METDGKTGTLVMDAMDVYHSATKTVYEFCGTLKPLLTSYLNQFEDHDTGISETEKNQLVQVLKKGGLQMIMAQLKIRIEDEGFNVKFAPKIAESMNSIKKAFKTEMQHIGELEVQISIAETNIKMDNVPDLHDTVVKSIQDLIAKCEEYRKRYDN